MIKFNEIIIKIKNTLNNLDIKYKNLKTKYKNLKKELNETKIKYDRVVQENYDMNIQNQLLKQKIDLIENKTYNKGEKEEVKTIKYLYSIRENIDELINIFGIDASQGIKIIDMDKKKEFTNDTIHLITKTSSKNKADVCIYFNKTQQYVYTSIKSLSGSPCAILNHTHRDAWVFKNMLSSQLSNIDLLVNEYIEKRTSKIISEDTPLINLDSLNSDTIKNSIIELLTYFIFDGSGSKKSDSSVNGILLTDKKTLKFLQFNDIKSKKDYVKTLLNHCIISLRHKGMPKKINENHKPWIYETDGKLKGAFHVRVKFTTL